MKNKFIITYEVIGGGGSQEIELDIPEDAYNIKIKPVRNTMGSKTIFVNDNFIEAQDNFNGGIIMTK